MATVKIGGVQYEIPELNFIALEKAWPYIERAIITRDPIEGTSAGISIIAAGLIEAPDFSPSRFGIEGYATWDDTFDRVVVFLKRALKAAEIANVRICVEDITSEAGLGEEDSGEAQAAPEEEASPSTETAPNSLQSSSQLDAKGVAGTA